MVSICTHSSQYFNPDKDKEIINPLYFLFSCEASAPEIEAKPKPGDPDFKEDLSLPMPVKPFKPNPQLTRSLNQYEGIDFMIRGSTAIADSSGKENKMEKNGICCEEMEKEGASQLKAEINKNRYVRICFVPLCNTRWDYIFLGSNAIILQTSNTEKDSSMWHSKY